MNILISDFDYNLPEDFIAQKAVEPRDSSKLLKFDKGQISHHVFNQIDELLPSNCTLVANDAKVIPARLFFKNDNNANIEIFLLQPFQSDYISTLSATKKCFWKCLIGNKRKWKTDYLFNHELQLKVSIMHFDENIIKFEWKSDKTFVEILEQLGKMPLPPYIKRNSSAEDKQRYQTVYSKTEGSVAAPTAGLHFTPQVLEKIIEKGIKQEFVTLHVSAGTFLPVTVENAVDHNMHSEFFSISKECLINILNSEKIVAVGTTSVRVLESLHQLAVNLFNNKENPTIIEKLSPYENSHSFSKKEIFEIIFNYLNKNNLEQVNGNTSIMILPNYKLKLVDGLITNFHQPKSTLLLLISAFVGTDWKNIYEEAKLNKYRFLSYGDSSLLLR